MTKYFYSNFFLIQPCLNKFFKNCPLLFSFPINLQHVKLTEQNRTSSSPSLSFIIFGHKLLIVYHPYKNTQYISSEWNMPHVYSIIKWSYFLTKKIEYVSGVFYFHLYFQLLHYNSWTEHNRTWTTCMLFSSLT